MYKRIKYKPCVFDYDEENDDYGYIYITHRSDINGFLYSNGDDDKYVVINTILG